MTGTNRLRASMAVVTLVVLSFPNGAAATDFGKATFYPVGTNPVDIATGDFNRDGKLDLAVANAGSSNVSILLGNGDGTFQSAVNFGAGIAAPESISVGDFNGDGKLDVAVFAAGNVTENLASAVSVLLGNGDGTFQAPKVTNLPIYTTQIQLADFNGDKKLDIAVSEFNTTFTLSILIGNGDGSFQTPSPLTDSISCTPGVPVVGCVVFATADFDNDGKIDLVVAGSGGLQVLLGKGDGTFRDGVTVAVADGYSVGWISTADLNGDGATDLVVLSTVNNCVGFNSCVTVHYSVFLGNGNGSFRAEQIFDTGSSSRDEFGFGHYDGIGNIVAADFDGDGKLDIVDRHSVKTSAFPGATPTVTLEVRLGRGDGTFATPIVFDDPGTIGIATDLNGDKLADLMTIGPSKDVEVLLNDSPTSGADLALTQTGASPEPAGVGQNLTYSAIVLNQGPENATGVTLTDMLPSGVKFISATSTAGSCVAANQVVTCSVGALAKAVSATVKIILTPTAAGTISNAMSVSGNETDGNSQNNSATQSSTIKTVYTLMVAKGGTGTGTVSASAGVSSGISCGNVCTEKYLAGSQVNLNENSDANSTFDSWSGACTGSQCTVTMDGDKTVTATFTALPDFQVSPGAASLALAWGGQASEPVAFSAVGGFTGMIAVTCAVTGPAPAPTCSASPNSVAAGGSVTLTVSATGLKAKMQPGADSGLGVRYAICLAFAMTGSLLSAGFDKKWARKWMACLLVLMAGVSLVACGGGGSRERATQSYMVAVTGVSGLITHTVNVNVTVGQ